ncbi:hypothetical protein tloyanaT_04760 [Thalassotalea loyana]|uniref:Type 4 fimbrial biogenesis protein PilX N-terminal domain-containing protein n=1 Tax=Thalassotalea loyana TaxID=280483 RepID=A0ABQ6H8B5_9GAMM|nr:hypothetical protein [Thalassotalea loyana]GLX84224.1 hypothetical protein tloyanaT_04760 [Thalassotalea loyana]
MFRNNVVPNRFNSQSGSMLIIAIFIMVVMLLIGAAMVNILTTSGQTVAYEVSGTRSYSAANSGAQIKLTEIFPLDDGSNNGEAKMCDGADLFSAASSSSNQTYQIIVDHNQNRCNVAVTCEDFHHDNVTYYQISSTATCSLGADTTSRTVIIEARSL